MNFRFNDPITNYLKKDISVLNEDSSVLEAMNGIRSNGISDEKIIYFYVCDTEHKLTGVIPTRRLLTASLDVKLKDIMINNVIAIPSEATVMEACEMFTMYKFLAYPVVDSNGVLLGTVDINIFTEELFNIGEHQRVEEIFEAVGFRISQLKNISPLKAFIIRFPWLTATVGSGVLCAIITSVYETTLSQNIILAFFLTMVLGLGESVTVQTLTLTIYSLKHERITTGWFFRELKKQAFLTLLLGAALGAMVALIVIIWKTSLLSAAAIGFSIMLSLVTACITGIAIPSLMHTLKLDPKIASGPVALAVSDVCTIVIYFSVAGLILR